MKKKNVALSLLSFASVVLLTACGNAATNTNEVSDTQASSSLAVTGTEIGDTIKLGYNFELSGEVASYGTTEKNGADLAVEEINAGGGVDGKQIEVVVEDNKSDTASAATATTSLVGKGVNVIVGPAITSTAAASLNAATDGGVPMISPSATQDDLVYSSDGKTINDYFFRTTFVDSYQGTLLASYATDTLKAKKAVLYYDNSSDYAKGIAEAFEDSYQGEVVERVTFSSGDKDFQAALTEVKKLDIDVIVMPGYYQETGAIVKQARDLGIDVPVIGPDGFDSPVFLEQIGKSTSDVYYLTAYSTKGSDKAKKFYDAYVAKYKEEPSMFSALAYDSVYMAAEAAKGAKTSVEIKDNLAKIADFEGVTGTMSVDKNHNVVKSAYVISIKNGAISEVEVLEGQ